MKAPSDWVIILTYCMWMSSSCWYCSIDKFGIYCAALLDHDLYEWDHPQNVIYCKALLTCFLLNVWCFLNRCSPKLLWCHNVLFYTVMVYSCVGPRLRASPLPGGGADTRLLRYTQGFLLLPVPRTGPGGGGGGGKAPGGLRVDMRGCNSCKLSSSSSSFCFFSGNKNDPCTTWAFTFKVLPVELPGGV